MASAVDRARSTSRPSSRSLASSRALASGLSSTHRTVARPWSAARPVGVGGSAGRGAGGGRRAGVAPLGELGGQVGLEVGDLAAELLGGVLDRQLDAADLDREGAGPDGLAEVGDHAGDVGDHPDQEHGDQRPRAPDGFDDPGRGHRGSSSGCVRECRDRQPHPDRGPRQWSKPG